MMYRRNLQSQRRYGYQSPDASKGINIPVEGMENSAVNKIMNIPLPNELESPSGFNAGSRISHMPNIIEFFKTRISIEEIILIGLIFILLDEGIHCIEDEFLLIILIYLLIT